MTLFLLRRLAFILPQLFVVIVGTFVLLRALDVDPVSKIAGSFATPETTAQVEASLGLDRSLGAQLQSYLGGLVQGDLGESWTTNEPVTSEIAKRFPVTIQLIGLGFGIAVLLAIPLGRSSAANPTRRREKITTVYALFAGAQPDFWWGLIFAFVFFFKLGWLPAPLGILNTGVSGPSGPTNFILIDTLVHGEFDLFLSALKHFVLPVMTMTFVLTGPILKIMRQAALDVHESEYVLYANAAGFSGKVTKKMITRNSFAPVLTVIGILFGFSLGGAVLIETVFSLNGIGRYALQSTLNVDFPAIQGAVIVMTAFSLLIYLTMDTAYALLDPRVRYSRV